MEDSKLFALEKNILKKRIEERKKKKQNLFVRENFLQTYISSNIV